MLGGSDIVEDDQLLGDALVAGLKQRGFEPDWVQDAREAQTASGYLCSAGTSGEPTR